MKRRAFLSLSALSAVPLDAQEANDGPEPNWHETVLIEWEYPEGCDSHSIIIRRIISKSKTVLRHRLCPPHEC